jgi:membrane protein
MFSRADPAALPSRRMIRNVDGRECVSAAEVQPARPPTSPQQALRLTRFSCRRTNRRANGAPPFAGTCIVGSPIVHFLRRSLRLIYEAFSHFLADDGWAIASHIALSTLMSIFPFFLVLTAIAGIVGSKNLADEAARILLEAWPEEVSAPIADQLHAVLTGAQGQVLTTGAVLALYFASSGIESLRIGLNRAYNMNDPRPMWQLRLESIGYVILGAIGLLALSFLVVLAPVIWRTAVRYLPGLAPLTDIVTLARLTIASVLLIATLMFVHLWLPAGRRSLKEIMPGIIVTLVLWLAAGILFGRYLADYAFTYSIYYAGLASVMIALVFLYFSACIFIYGGELNAVIQKARREKALAQGEGTGGKL